MYKLDIPNYNGDFDKDKKKLNELIQKRIDGKITQEEFEELKELNSKIFGYVDNVKNDLTTIFSNPLKDIIGHGQDNIVRNYNRNWVIKVLTKTKYESHENLKDYFLYKYKLLKKYMKEFITDTYFLEGEAINPRYINYNNLTDYEVKYKTIYTVQRKIKGYTLNDLPTDIRENPELLLQLKNLHKKYIRLKLYLHYIEYNKYGKIGKLKYNMDIGRISNSINVRDDILISYKTPNIMYDIEKNRIFLIDFDTGNLDKYTKDVFDIINKKSYEEIDKIGNNLFEEIRKKYQKITNNNLQNFFKDYANK